MQLGFNENILHNGQTYHVQTEDGGKKNPMITTTIFKGGGIVTTKRTSYADILKSNQLNIVVKEIVRKQHNTVVNDLKKGVFDEVAQTPSEAKEKTPTVEKSKDVSLSSEEKKEIDDIILEYLSIGEKKQ
jgi:hypothetical protein